VQNPVRSVAPKRTVLNLAGFRRTSIASLGAKSCPERFFIPHKTEGFATLSFSCGNLIGVFEKKIRCAFSFSRVLIEELGVAMFLEIDKKDVCVCFLWLRELI